jgi:hypothetical protein
MVRLVVGLVAASVAASVVPAALAAVPDGKTTVACPASVSGAKELSCVVMAQLSQPAADGLLLTIKGPADAQATGVTGPPGSTCSIDVTQALCLLPAGFVGSGRVDVRFGFELPDKLPVGKNTVTGNVSATMPVGGDPTPADNGSKDAISIRYPRSTRTMSMAGAGHARARPAQFCGIALRSGATVTGAWCVSQVTSSGNGGKWGNGTIGAMLGANTRFLPHSTRNRRIEIDVQLQVRATTAYGGGTWKTALPARYRNGSYWQEHPSFLGTTPFMSWTRPYVGAQGRGWLKDHVSMEHPGEMYRAQVRFRFYESPVRKIWRKMADSGWWTIRYQNSGIDGWGI